jgi:hypothetical protein
MLLLQGCVFRPEVTQVAPEPGCTYRPKEMVLKMDVAHGVRPACATNYDCAAMLVVAGAVATASAVVSGSIVIVGNAVYWLEKQGKCLEPDPSAVS